MPDEEPTTSTGSEPASAEGQVAPETQETPTAEPAAEADATEPAPEPQPSAEEEEDARVKAAVDAQFGETAPEPVESDKLTLSKAELEERERRAAQSAADRATEEVRRETQRQQEMAQARGRIRADMRRDIGEALKKAVDNGDTSDAFLDDINRRYGTSLFEEANEALSRFTHDEFFQAMGAVVPGIADATPEELAPLGKPFARLADEFAAALGIAMAFKEKQVKAEMADWAEKEAAKKARVATEAGIKKILADLRGAQKGGELPKGESIHRTTLTLAAYRDMTPEERKQVSKEDIDAMTRGAMGVA